jgi:hypothetical protein
MSLTVPLEIVNVGGLADSDVEEDGERRAWLSVAVFAVHRTRYDHVVYRTPQLSLDQ